MFRWYELVGTLALGLSLSAQADFPGIGQPATESEIRVWDTDIGPDLSRLPNARGSVREGREIYRVHCAGCHGVDGRSADVFYPLVGGTTDDDVAAGRVAGLRDAGVASSSTMMLLPTLTTLLDYTARAMPFGEAGSLSHDEVFSVSAFVLHLAGVVDEAFVPWAMAWRFCPFRWHGQWRHARCRQQALHERLRPLKLVRLVGGSCCE